MDILTAFQLDYDTKRSTNYLKFHHSLTRSSARAVMPENKMKAVSTMMYCELVSICIKDERKICMVAALVAINGRASYCRNGRKRVS
uniref:Ovule protein n=1 Tax=Strongyloides papillosus TaxID=174720 RepID=A0A0N5BQU9_STREA